MAVVNDIEGLLDWGRVNGVETHPNVAVKNGPDGERGVFYVHEREQQQRTRTFSRLYTAERIMNEEFR